MADKRRPFFQSPAIYASAKEAFSRPMTGHTPQKLPPFKRNLLHHRIAFGGVSPAQQTYDTTALANCQAFFQNILQRFAVKFGDNRDFCRGTSVRTLRTLLFLHGKSCRLERRY
ncbi:MAG: hypothetical protein PUK18_08325 [Firmicutes bacterium]|nr:hypothetical protein [Bacillota bacterium]MDY6160333.1 hypothetical protein [Candidatus Faecousia sp.]